jgi:hypothetical protein
MGRPKTEPNKAYYELGGQCLPLRVRLESASRGEATLAEAALADA